MPVMGIIGQNRNWSHWALIVSQVWCVLALILIGWTDVMGPQLKTLSDYHTSFYIAGYAVLHGLSGSLYPAAQATFNGARFDELARQLIPQLPANLVACFMYSPLVAAFFAPFALLPPQYGLLVWQLLGVAALAYIAYSAKANSTSAWAVFVAIWTFLPVFATIWIGQLGVCFGLLPLWLGYRQFRAGKPLLAGAIWSLLLLKPQLYPVAVLCSLAFALSGQFACFVGLLVGSSALLLVSVFCLGPHSFWGWLNSLTVSETLLSGSIVSSPGYLVACVPGAILSGLPIDARLALKVPVYAGAMAIGLFVVFFLLGICRGRLEIHEKRTMVLFLSVLCLPLISPRLLLYDLCIYVLCALMVYVTDSEALTRLKRPILAGWVFINLYILTVIFTSGRLSGMVLACGLTVLNIWAFAMAGKVGQLLIKLDAQRLLSVVWIIALFSLSVPTVLVWAFLRFLGTVSDFPEFYSAGHFVLSGNAAFAYDLSRMAQAQHQFFSHMGERVVGFYMPPTGLLFFAPLGWFSVKSAAVIWIVLQLVSVVVSLWLLAKLWVQPRHYYLLVMSGLFLSGPFYEAVRLGQPAPLLMVSLVTALFFLFRDKPVWAAVSLLPFALKPQLLFPLLFFFLGARRYRFVISTGAMLMLTVALAFVLAGGQYTYEQYLRALATALNSEGLQGGMAAYLNPTIRGQLLRIDAVPASLVGTISLATMIACWGGLLWFGRRFQQHEQLLALAVVVAMPLGLLTALHCHQYDFLLLLPALVAFDKLPSVDKVIGRFSRFVLITAFSLPVFIFVHYTMLLQWRTPVNPLFLATAVFCFGMILSVTRLSKAEPRSSTDLSVEQAG